MIIKNLTRRQGSGQLVRYIFKYILAEEKADNTNGPPFIVKHNIRSDSINGFISEFQKNEKKRIRKQSNQTDIHHTIISFAPESSEHLTREKIQAIFKEYVKLRGIGNLYCGTIHADRGHLHLHVAMSATGINGKASRISKKEFAQVKGQLQQYQERTFPELHHSVVAHGKSIYSSIPDHSNSRYQSKKKSLHDAIQQAYDLSDTQEAFHEKLTQLGYPPYFRGGKMYGVVADGRNYRFSTLGFSPEIKEVASTDQISIGEIENAVEKPLEEKQPLEGDQSEESSEDTIAEEIPESEIDEAPGVTNTSEKSIDHIPEISFTVTPPEQVQFVYQSPSPFPARIIKSMLLKLVSVNQPTRQSDELSYDYEEKELANLQALREQFSEREYDDFDR